MVDLSTGFALAASVVVAAASQMVTGFGFSIVLVPLLLFWLAPSQAIALTSVLGAVLTTLYAIREWAFVLPRRALLLFGSSLLGIPLGIVALDWLPLALLQWLVAGVVVCAIGVVLGGLAWGRGRPASALAGWLSGVLLTSTGMNGPPLVAAMRAGGHGEREYRATLAAVFCGQGWVGFLMLAAARKVEWATLGLVGIGVLALPLGLALGAQVLERLNARHVKLAIVLMLAGCLVKLLV